MVLTGIIIVIIISLLGSPCFGAYTVDFSFDRDTQGWWTFNDKRSMIKLSTDNEAALKNAGSLKVEFEYAGAGSYLGLGVETKYTFTKGDWSQYGYGGLVLLMKGCSEFNVSVLLETREGTFSTRARVSPVWKKYSMPWESFTRWEKYFEAFYLEVKKIQIRPGGNKMKGKHTLYIDEIGFESYPISVEKKKSINISGYIKDINNKGVKQAQILFSKNVKDTFGWHRLIDTFSDNNGKFNLKYLYGTAPPYKVDVLEKVEEKEEEEEINDDVAGILNDDTYFLAAEFQEPVDFDTINIINCGHLEEPNWNTKNAVLFLKTPDSTQWQLFGKITDNKKNEIQIQKSKKLTATGIRIEIEDPVQAGEDEYARIYEIQFFNKGELNPVQLKSIKANHFSGDHQKPKFVFDSDVNTKWFAMVKGILVKEYKLAYRLKIDALGYKSLTRVLDLSNVKKNKGMNIKLKKAEIKNANIQIEYNNKIRKINPWIYGINVGIWAVNSLDSPDAIDAIKEAGITVLRFPGGARSQGMKWVRRNATWVEIPEDKEGLGYNCVVTPNYMDTFMKICKAVNAEPMFSVNVERKNTENASDFIRYCNIEKKYGLKLIEMGNEPEGYVQNWGFGKNWNQDPVGLEKTYSKVADIYMEYRNALLAIDDSLIFLGPVTGNQNFFWDIPYFWKKVGKELDCLSVHRYPQTDTRRIPNAHLNDAELLDKPGEWRINILELQKYEKEYSPDFHPLYAVTEWNNCYHSPGPRQWNLVGTLYNAKNLCELIYTGFDISCFWDLIGTGYYSVIDVKGKKVIKHYPFYLFKILANHFLGNMIEVKTSESLLLNVYASINQDKLVLVVFNTSPDTSFLTDINIDEKVYSLKYKGYIMDDTRKYHAFEGKLKDTYKFTPYSLTLLKFQKRK